MMLPPLPLPLLFLSLPSLAAAGLFASTDRLSVPTREILDLGEDITLANASSLVRTDRRQCPGLDRAADPAAAGRPPTTTPQGPLAPARMSAVLQLSPPRVQLWQFGRMQSL